MRNNNSSNEKGSVSNAFMAVGIVGLAVGSAPGVILGGAILGLPLAFIGASAGLALVCSVGACCSVDSTPSPAAHYPRGRRAVDVRSGFDFPDFSLSPW